MGTGSFPGVKSGRGVMITPRPLLVPWSWKSGAIPLLPLWAVRPVQSLSACTRVQFTFLYGGKYFSSHLRFRCRKINSIPVYSNYYTENDSLTIWNFTCTFQYSSLSKLQISLLEISTAGFKKKSKAKDRILRKMQTHLNATYSRTFFWMKI